MQATGLSTYTIGDTVEDFVLADVDGNPVRFSDVTVFYPEPVEKDLGWNDVALTVLEGLLSEAFRVLKPGGRLCVADLTIVEEDLPPEIITHPSAWAG